ncbi:MAG: thiamine pyrophosphate-dependent enzyme [Dehalococcoidia bacterium]|nr:thiamine pyrophosphate-dependent enzyme [Dehalococcoidia bacterium]
MMKRVEALKAIADFRTDAIVVFTMGAMQEWDQISPGPFNLQSSQAMGYASSVGLGLAIACPDKKVIVLDGDGSLLMNLGILVTIANEAPKNFIHVVLENGIYEIAGQEPLPGIGKFSLRGLALAAGAPKAYEIDDLRELREQLPTLMSESGPIFLGIKTEPGPREPVRKGSAVEMARTLEKALQPGYVVK